MKNLALETLQIDRERPFDLVQSADYQARRTAILDNYRTLTLHRGNRKRKRRLMNQEKGFKEEAAAFVDAVKSGGPMPIDFESLVAVTRATFLVHESLDNGSAVDLDLAWS